MTNQPTNVLQLLELANDVFGKNHGQLRAYAALLGFRNVKTGIAYPSYKTLATKARCSETTVSKMVQEAERAGLLVVVRKYQRKWIRGVYRKIRAVNRYLILAKPSPLKTLVAQAARTLTQPVRKIDIVTQQPLELDSQGATPLDRSLARFQRLFEARRQESGQSMQPVV